MIQAVLGNPSHPEYGVATIPFPIPRDQYAHCMELLEALEIGDAVKTDCKVKKIDSFYTVLKRAEMLNRTIAFQVPEELFERLKDYLARNGLKQKDFILGLIERELNDAADVAE